MAVGALLTSRSVSGSCTSASIVGGGLCGTMLASGFHSVERVSLR